MPSPSRPAAADLIASQCLAHRARLLGRTLTGIYDEALRPLGMTIGQLNTLVVLAKRGPLTQADVGRILNVEKSTLSRNVERMRNHGWIVAAPSGSGRGQTLSLHASGRKQIEKAAPRWKEAQAAAKSLLGARGARSLRSTADNVRSRLTPE